MKHHLVLVGASMKPQALLYKADSLRLKATPSAADGSNPLNSPTADGRVATQRRRAALRPDIGHCPAGSRSPEADTGEPGHIGTFASQSGHELLSLGRRGLSKG